MGGEIDKRRRTPSRIVDQSLAMLEMNTLVLSRLLA
eukprot:SAG11_NODE_21802_length_418_cov_1.288401_1_plen_35_part_10